ncbi:GNAT family N-acetyltransferase [Acinetobacter sp. ANC 4204]|uniref:GNAT family N-acetyltransferase n=1 Tax=Acinetobacter sp. ANC 4204 TaxID=1977884 RepID=UPI000A332075|nr:GNAT family N-acetyltransferase [Acinetobacter sp. ANC 4204]OTG58830.1 GNAT family N-acetyltransferase [Acinetobacter sp. ANC 4204]
MLVRTAKLPDVPALVALGKSFIQEAPNYSSRDFDADALLRNLEGVISGQGAVFVVESDQKIIGGIVCLTTKDWFNNDVIAFEQVFYVQPEYRASRVPLFLIDAFVNWAKHMGASRIQCGTTTGINTKGCLRLYERFGFREYGTLLDMEL